MKRFLIPLAACVLMAGCVRTEPALKDVFAGTFILGTAINDAQIAGEDIKGDSVLIRHFAAIEPENCLKSGEVMPVFGQYDWILADKYVEFGEKYNLDVYGHTLIWHSQCTPDFCYDENGNLISPELLNCHPRYIGTESIDGHYSTRLFAAHHPQGQTQTLHLLSLRDRFRTRTRGAATDIYHRSSLSKNLVSTPCNRLLSLHAALCEKRVGRHVQDTHHQWL